MESRYVSYSHLLRFWLKHFLPPKCSDQLRGHKDMGIQDVSKCSQVAAQQTRFLKNAFLFLPLPIVTQGVQMEGRSLDDELNKM
jgi:hypothetical protein